MLKFTLRTVCCVVNAHTELNYYVTKITLEKMEVSNKQKWSSFVTKIKGDVKFEIKAT